MYKNNIHTSSFAVVIITNGTSLHLDDVISCWLKNFELGVDLFLCGPVVTLKNLYTEDSIIDYDEHVVSDSFFSINKKKQLPFERLKFDYLFILHDRFIPNYNFKKEFQNIIDLYNPDYGGVDVFNLDGTPSLKKLTLNDNFKNLSINDALSNKGRLVVNVNDSLSSNIIALNGGAFFLKTSLSYIFNRPLRWSEMEDDVMSFDLKEYNGIWVDTTFLKTVINKKISRISFLKKIYFDLKFFLYGAFCRILFSIILLFNKNRLSYYSITDSINLNNLSCMENFYLVDPLHKFYSATYFHSAPEKLLCRLRVELGIERPIRVVKNTLGWEFIICG